MSEYKKLTKGETNICEDINCVFWDGDGCLRFIPLCERRAEEINRLAEYEDSGLSPEEVAELAKAKEEGRIEPPDCKTCGGRGWIEIHEQYENGASVNFKPCPDCGGELKGEEN